MQTLSRPYRYKKKQKQMQKQNPEAEPKSEGEPEHRRPAGALEGKNRAALDALDEVTAIHGFRQFGARWPRLTHAKAADHFSWRFWRRKVCDTSVLLPLWKKVSAERLA